MRSGLPFDRAFRRAALLTIGLWLMVWGLWAVGELIAGRSGFVAEAPIDLPATLLKAVLAVLLYPVCLHTHDWPAARRWTVIVATVMAVALVQAGIELAEVRLISLWPHGGEMPWPNARARIASSLLNNAYLSFATAALLAFQVEVHCAGEQRLRLARAETAAERAQMAALRFQLNPHFLFNTLNAISSLVVTKRTADAEEMLSRLSGFLRNALAAEPNGVVTLDEEAESIEAYLQIEQVRFGDRMRIEIDYPAALGDVLVPGLILQPLVENAVKYGVAHARDPVTVAVTAQALGEVVEIVVRDNGSTSAPGGAVAGLGVGHRNIRQRLEALHGQSAGMAAGRTNGWYEVRLRLPLSRR